MPNKLRGLYSPWRNFRVAPLSRLHLNIRATMNWGRTLIVLAAVNLSVSNCDGPRGIASSDPAATSYATATTQPQIYRLALGDKVKITVFNEPDVSGEFQINSAGRIALPLGGDVVAVNRTADELERAVAAKLNGRYVKNPRVAVEVSSYRPFNVVGEVKNAGQYAYRPGLTIHDAVAMAGGYTYRANTHTVYVRGQSDKGERTINSDNAPVTVSPGDNIRVPERYF
jgi:polysaccharide export outer membrane protein